MEKLALFGGRPVIKKRPFDYISIGSQESRAVERVMKKGVLSNFYGSFHDNFYGGEEVKSFEKAFSRYFGFKHAVSLNSATSGLYAALGALEIKPKDEVIVTPYSMSCSAVAPLLYGGVPVFADIEEETYCLDPKSVSEKITHRTKAIIVVHLFGHTARMDDILKIAKENGIKIIEDCAQAIGAQDKGRFAGSFGDISVFSFNCHKTINTGEGGMCVTQNEELAKRLQLIRNHAEAVVGGGFKVKSLNNLLGFNWRMGELESAIGKEQLKKLKKLNSQRIELASFLSERLKKIEGIVPPVVREGCSHVWYVYCPKNKTKIPRNLLAKALSKEGVPIAPGYVEPLYNLPIFKKHHQDNFSLKREYKNSCSVCERIERKELLQLWGVRPPLTKKDMKDIYYAFEKVLSHKKALGKAKDFSLPKDPASRRSFLKE